MRLLPLLALAALPLAGCGDISNAWILEDAEYLDALPSSSRHTVALDIGAAKGLEDAPSLLQMSYAVGYQVNLTIFEVLNAMDEVRQLRPTERTENGRSWGPFPWREGVDLRAWIERTGEGRFDWGVDAIVDGETLPYIAGTHYAGDTVANGDGEFTWSFDVVAVPVGDPTRGTVTVDYDNRDGTDLLVAIDGVTDGTYAPVTADYAYRLVDGEGDFQYFTVADLGDAPDGDPEDVSVRTRWYSGAGGRSDAVVTGGTLDGYVEEWTQCWDGALGLTYEQDTFGWVVDTGEESACVFPEFAELDRL